MNRVINILLILTVSIPATASAHAQYKPFTLNRYSILAFESPGLHLTYNVTVGDLPAQRLRKRFDENKDGVLQATERSALIEWARSQIAGALEISLDGQALPLEPGQAEVDLVTDQVQMFSPIWLRFHMRLPCPPGKHKLIYHDRSEFPDLDQSELFIRRARHVRLSRAARPQKDRGVVERFFWNDGQAPSPVWIQFQMAAPGQRLAPEPEPAAAGQAREHANEGAALKKVLMDERLGLGGLLAALGLAFLLGAAHALSPGHGKTLVAAYLVGSHGTVRHALLLGAIVTFTHVFSVVLLGLVALWASDSVVPERLTPWIALAAGLLVVGMGGWMLLRRLKGHGHSHGHSHDHSHNHEDGHDRGQQGVRFGELLALGITGGMIPCPSATVVLLLAIYLGRTALGLALIGAFSLGLATSLVAIGIVVVRGRKLLARFSEGPRATKIIKLLPLISALLICLIGLTMTGLAIAGL